MRLATLLLACGAAAAAAESATITVDFDRPGARIPADFLGISYEKNALVEPHFTPANTTLINLHRNLGAGTLRLALPVPVAELLDASQAFATRHAACKAQDRPSGPF